MSRSARPSTRQPAPRSRGGQSRRAPAQAAPPRRRGPRWGRTVLLLLLALPLGLGAGLLSADPNLDLRAEARALAGSAIALWPQREPSLASADVAGEPVAPVDPEPEPVPPPPDEPAPEPEVVIEREPVLEAEPEPAAARDAEPPAPPTKSRHEADVDARPAAPRTPPPPRPAPKAAPAEAPATPAAAPARKLPVADSAPRGGAGALTPDQRRARLAGLRWPAGFTGEWAGGAAQTGVAANEIVRGPTDRQRVALTFDGNWEDGPVPELLQILGDRGLKATFFVTGDFCRRFPGAIRAVAAGGHEVANHSMTHPEFTKLSDAGVLAELEKAEREIVALAGDAYRPYWRPPFGDRDTRVLRVAIKNGFIPIYWTADTLDWQKQATAASVLQRLTKLGLKPGAIILQHIGSGPTLEALPGELDLLAKHGLQPGSLGQLFG